MWGDKVLDKEAIDLIDKLLSEKKDVEIQVRNKNLVIWSEKKKKVYTSRKDSDEGSLKTE